MPKVNIDLGHEMGEMPEPMEIRKDSVMYPTFHVESKKEIGFPHEGEMTIKFKKVASSMNERDDGPPRYSCTIEVHKITELYPEESDEPEERSGDALDRIAKTVREARGSGKSSY